MVGSRLQQASDVPAATAAIHVRVYVLLCMLTYSKCAANSGFCGVNALQGPEECLSPQVFGKINRYHSIICGTVAFPHPSLCSLSLPVL